VLLVLAMCCRVSFASRSVILIFRVAQDLCQARKDRRRSSSTMMQSLSVREIMEAKVFGLGPIEQVFKTSFFTFG